MPGSVAGVRKEGKTLGISVFLIKLQSDIISFLCFAFIIVITAVTANIIALAIDCLTAESMEL